MVEISLYSFDSFMKHKKSLVLGRKFHFGKNLAYERILVRFQHKFNWTNSIYAETTVSLTMFKHLLQHLFIFLSLKGIYIYRITLFSYSSLSISGHVKYQKLGIILLFIVSFRYYHGEDQLET